MTIYLLRIASGEVIAEIPTVAGMDILTNMAGLWSSVDYPKGLPVQRFTLQEGRVLTIVTGEFKITLLLREGMMLDLPGPTNTACNQILGRVA